MNPLMTDLVETTMAAWAWGMAAFIVLCGFPGNLARQRFRSLTWVEAVALSIGTNASLVLLLNLAGAYHRGVVRAYVLAALGLCGFTTIRNSKNLRFHWTSDRLAPWLAISPILLLVFYLAFFFPFVQWDAVASWNRWAVSFTLEPDCLLKHRWFYPQFLSFSYSFIYKAAGDTNMVQLAHGLAFMHVVILVGAVEELSRQVGIKNRVAMGLVFMSTPFAQHVSSGYADIPSAAFATVSASVLLKSDASRIRAHSLLRCGFAGWLAAVAVLHKQLGAVPFIMLPLAWTLSAARGERRSRLFGASIFLASGTISLLPWTLRLGDWFGSHMGFLTQGIYGNMAWSTRVVQAGKTLLQESSIILFPRVNAVIALGSCALAFLALFAFPRSRVCTFTAMMATTAYALFFSYDTRALMAAVPLFCVGVAAGGEAILVRLCNPPEKIMRRTGYALSLLLACLATAYQIHGAWERIHYFQYVATSSAFTIRPWAGNQEKLALFIDGYADLLAWEKAHPLPVHLQYWLSDPRLCAMAQGGKSKRLDGLLGNLMAQDPAKPQWRPGDVLLISTNDVSLNAFIDKHVEKGWITALDKIGCFTGYLVHEIHEPNRRGACKTLASARSQGSEYQGSG